MSVVSQWDVETRVFVYKKVNVFASVTCVWVTFGTNEYKKLLKQAKELNIYQKL